MHLYAQKLADILNHNNIEPFYDIEKKQVSAFVESSFGDIYCLFQRESDYIRSYYFFQEVVKPTVADEVASYLEGLNKEIPFGHFYIDNIQSRVVYSMDCLVPEANRTSSLEQFFLHSYSIIKNQRQLLFWMLTGQMIK